MALEKIVKVTGRAVYVPGDDIDTDRIIPARFMKCVTFDGLGAHVFHDVRFSEDGSMKDHALNDSRFAGAKILLSNSNFGCGSSREHAPQALAKSGFRAVVAESFAEIFFGNSTTLGMPCVSVSHDAIVQLSGAVEGDPSLEVGIDLESRTVSAGSLRFPLTIKETARDALMRGAWDPIGQLLDGAEQVRALTARLPYLQFQS
ncbi:MAG TPA: 3-isopropylmalate dehydratase small subunit [Polyangiaceae bacterium]|nr:3-isopropylmalate dehydratase small subunit [Polyangiaceae bacterium]